MSHLQIPSVGPGLRRSGATLAALALLTLTVLASPCARALDSDFDGVGDVLNVRSFGAKGDGTTDDWHSILDAVAAIRTDSVLYFPPGVYITSGPIYIANKSHFAVLGEGATIRVGAATPYVIDLANYPRAYDAQDAREFSVMEIYNCSDWVVEGLLLDGNYQKRGMSTRELSHGMHLAGCHCCTVRSVEAQYCQGDGIFLSAMNDLTFPHARTPASNCSEFALRDIKAHHIARNSISVDGASDGVIDGLIDSDIGTDIDNSAKHGPWSGVHFEVDESESGYEVAERVMATNLDMRRHRPDNNIEGGGNGGAIRFSNRAKEYTVRSFRYEQETPNQQHQSIIVIGRNCSYITISDGTILVKNAARDRLIPCYGVLLEQASAGAFPHHVTVERVTVDGPTYGVRVSSGGEHIRIANNIVRNTSVYALWLLGGCEVTENQLLNEVGSATFDTAFVQVQGSEFITCDHNILGYDLTSGIPPEFYFMLSVGATQFSANYNICYGIPGTSFNYFGSPQLSFVGNEFF
jgi:hypothetical protein